MSAVILLEIGRRQRLSSHFLQNFSSYKRLEIFRVFVYRVLRWSPLFRLIDKNCVSFPVVSKR